MAEYYMESMADEFPSDANNAKRGISKPNVIFFLIDDLGEKTQIISFQETQSFVGNTLNQKL